MKKRVISLMLIFTMMFSLETFAATTITTNSKLSFKDLKIDDSTNIGDVLTLGIMKGDDLGYFNPNETLTKAQAACMVLRMTGKNSSFTYKSSIFKDVTPADWFSQEVIQAYNLGIVQGDGNGYFNPNKELNAIELITMCLRITGIGSELDSTGYWPYAHMQFVNDYNIISNYTNSVYDPITRLDAAGIVSDFLSANVWQKNARTGEYEMQDDTVASKYLGVETYKDCIITAVRKDDNELDLLYKDSDGEYTNELEDVYVKSPQSINDYEVGMVINLSLNGSTAMKINIQDEASSRIVLFDQIVDYDTEGSYIKVKVNGKTSKYYFNDYQLTAEVNGTVKTGYENKMSTVKRLIEENISDEVEISEDETETVYAQVSGRLVLDENSKIISINIARYDYIMNIKSISGTNLTGYSYSTLNTVSSLTKTSFSLKNKDYTIKDIDGAEISLSDLAKGDVILYSSEEPYYILKLDETVYGTVTARYGYTTATGSVRDEDIDVDEMYVTISNTDYYLNTKFCTSLPTKSSTKRTLYLDQNGLIVGWK